MKRYYCKHCGRLDWTDYDATGEDRTTLECEWDDCIKARKYKRSSLN
jgi:hypothetical protein